MAFTLPLIGDLADLGLNDFQIGPGNARKIRGYVRTNLGAGDALIDTTNQVTLLGDTPITILSNGTWSVDLLDTSSTDLNVEANTLQYELVVEYTSTGSPAKRVYRSGWFALTEADLELVDDVPMAVFSSLDLDLPSVTPSWRSAFAAEMEAIRDETAVISGLTGEDAAVALLIDTPASDTATALSATIATERFADMTDQLDITPPGGVTTAQGVWDLAWGNDEPAFGFAWHLGTGDLADAAAGFVGVHVGKGRAFLFDNKGRGGTAIRINMQNFSDVSDPALAAASIGFMGSHQSVAASTLMRLQQTVAGAGVLQRWEASAAASGQVMCVWSEPTGTAGSVAADTGNLTWNKDVTVRARSGLADAKLVIQQREGVTNAGRMHLFVEHTTNTPQIRGYRHAGSGNYYAHRIEFGSGSVKFQFGTAAAVPGAETYGTAVLELQPDKIGAFGATPVAKPTGVAVTAAGIHAALVSLGLIGA